jgi:hypothetical protein
VCDTHIVIPARLNQLQFDQKEFSKWFIKRAIWLSQMTI